MNISSDGFTTRRIPHTMTHDWLLKKHYAHRLPSISFSFGLYDSNKQLQGVCTFGKPASPSLCDGICGTEYSFRVYELNRLCVNEGLPANTLSWFVTRCLTHFRRTGFIFVSYADSGQNHHGYIYQATNWLYTGITKERTDIGNEDGTHSRHYDKNCDYSTNRKFRTAKHRYVLFIGNKKFKKEMTEKLNYEVLPYPKGDNKRYDASYEPIPQGVLI